MGKRDSGDIDLLAVFPTSAAARAGYKEIIRASEGGGGGKEDDDFSRALQPSGSLRDPKKVEEERVMLHFYNKSAKKINGIVRNPRTKASRIYQMDMLFISKEEREMFDFLETPYVKPEKR